LNILIVSVKIVFLANQMNSKLKLSIPFLFLFLAFAENTFGQTSIEKELKLAVKNAKGLSNILDAQIALGNYYKNTQVKKADSLAALVLKNGNNSNTLSYAKALLFHAEISEVLGNQEAFFKDIENALPLIKSIRDESFLISLNNYIGNYYLLKLDFFNSRQYFQQAEKLATKSRQNNLIAETYVYMALQYMYENQKDSAEFYTDKALSYARRSSSKEIKAYCLNIQAKIFDYFGQIELSVAKNINALQIAAETNNLYQLSKFNREIGIAQRTILNLDDAEYYFKQAIDYAKIIQDDRQWALALTNLGLVYFDRKEYQKALKTTEQSIFILEKLNDINGLGESYNNLGIINREQKKFIEAASNFNQALVYFESTNNKEKIAGVYHNVGTVFQKQGKYKNALNYLEKSIQIREKYGSKNEIYKTYRVISEVHKSLGNTQKSLYYLQLYLDYMDGNTTIQSARKIAELSEAYRSDQRERLISSQSDSIYKQQQEKTLTATKLENSQLRNNLMFYVIVALIIIAGLGVIIGFYRWNQVKIKQQRKEAEMSQTLLRAQMNPHFVFNAMSVIQSYIYENDTVNSSKFLVNFSRLMRLILENSSKEFIPLETEIEILEKYLAMQKLRFEERFEFYIKIDETINNDFTVIPPMITQPFIENAIEHGQLHTIEGGFISVSFNKVNDMLSIHIEDNGIGRKGSMSNKKSKAHKSMAMQITRERIDNINKKYKTSGSLDIQDFNKTLETGTKVLILLPLREEKPNL
jgi:tetratricopeptide (TPR) repeat protein